MFSFGNKSIFILILPIVLAACFASFAMAGASLKISGISPSSAQIDANVTVSGTGFSSTAALDAVFFRSANGVVPAAVLSASAKKLVVQVPNGAVTGSVSVQVGSASSNSAQFTVVSAPTNTRPIINTGSAQTVTLPSGVTLSGTVSDDGLPNPPAAVSVSWTKIAGPGTVAFGNPASPSTTAVFSSAGVYTLRLTASDSALSASADVNVTVNPPATSGHAPTVDAWPPKTIALPAHDVTLFGHASDPDNEPLTVQWTQTSGPAPVVFSAPSSLTTTVSFTAAGIYGFDLSVSDGVNSVTSSTTVGILTAASQTAFYVDPTYTGGNSDGSAAHPWTSLATGSVNAQWVAINNALASNNVIVYFSARQAGADVSEVERNPINIWRTDKGTNRLTLDGMSQYNSNDATPFWAPYGGVNKFQIRQAGGSVSIGVQSDQTLYPMNNTTIRGFDVTSRVTFAGNESVVEYIYSHDVVGQDPTILFHSAVHPDCTPAFGNLHDITIRNIRIERGMGEGIYINGNYILATDGGCPSWGNTHRDILVERNAIIDPGANGGQGDGLDFKAGLINVTIRANLIQHTDGGLRAASQGAKGIVSSGVFNSSATKSNFLVENNLLINAPSSMMFSYINTLTIRNNVVINAVGSGIGGSISTNFNDEPSPVNFDVNIYNNTIYYGGIGLLSTNRAMVRNNLISGLGSGSIQLSQHGSCVNVNSDYNSLVSTASTDNWAEGSHSIYLPGNASLFVNPSTYNLRLLSGVGPVSTGVALSPGFADFDGMVRPQGGAWDIGAYKFMP